MNKTIGANDKVMFSNEVLRRCGHSADVAGMRGVVIEIKGGVATVNTNGTYPNEEGNPVRFIPAANLVLA